MAVCCVPGTALDTLMMMMVVVVAAAIAVNYGSMTGLALHMRGSVTYILPLTTMERGFMVPFLNRNFEREKIMTVYSQEVTALGSDRDKSP